VAEDGVMTLNDVIQKYKAVYPDDRSVEPYICLLYGLALGIDAQLVYEIGVGAGMSTHALLLAMQLTGGKLVSCDVMDRERVVEDDGLHAHWRFLHMTSAQMAVAERDRADMVYLDGCHEYHAVRTDWRLFWPLLRQNGLMVLHDWKSVPSGPGQVYLDMSREGIHVVGVPTMHGIAIARKV
jgi:predicted O-methyltransferase YrrM